MNRPGKSALLTALVALVLAALPRAAAADLLIEGLDGPVTPREIAAFKAEMARIEPGDSNAGNNYVYGNGGKGIEALGDMYEVTGDPVILDRMIHFADHMLAARNDLGGERRTIWTGRVELCWPNKRASAADAAYCGTENGDVVGHIAACAEMILDSPMLWSQVVPDGDPYHHGRTYLERARTFVREGDRTVDELLLPWFVDPSSKRFHVPSGAGYAALGPRYAKDAGHGAPWNQQMMLAGAFQHLATCHAILGDDRARVKRYDKVVKTAMRWFRDELVSYQVAGKTVFKWSYATGDGNLKYMEDAGHGGYDVWGLWKAKRRSAYQVPGATMRGLAATVRYVMAAGTDGKLSARVDGKGGRKAVLGSTWLLLAQYDPALFRILANPALLAQAKKRIDVAARILWMKHQLSGGFDGLIDSPDEAEPEDAAGSSPVEDTLGVTSESEDDPADASGSQDW